MSKDSGDGASQLQELISRALRQQVRSNQRFADLLRRIGKGELNGQQVREEFRQFSEAEASEYTRSLTNLGVSFFSHLLELNQGFNERFFQRLGHPGEKEQQADEKPRVRVQLRGAQGSTVRAGFVVENRRDEASDVALVFSKLSSANGVSFQAPFVAEPAAFRLPPGEERSVEITLALLPELFTPGEEYSCQVSVRGPEDMVLDLAIAVDSVASAEPDAAAAPGESGVSAADTGTVKSSKLKRPTRSTTKKTTKKAIKTTAKKTKVSKAPHAAKAKTPHHSTT